MITTSIDLQATVASGINYVAYSAGIREFEAVNKIVRGTAASAKSFDGAFGMLINSKLVRPARLHIRPILSSTCVSLRYLNPSMAYVHARVGWVIGEDAWSFSS